MPFEDLTARVSEVRERIEAAAQRGGRGQAVTIVAVTKTHGPDAPRAAWEAGIADVGENKVQEAMAKLEAVELPLRWHLIGHLQRNKVRSLPSFHLFHALDSARLADAIDAVGVAQARPVEVLLQVNIAGEATKGGFTLADVDGEANRLAGLRGLRVRGAMTMAPFDADDGALRRVFAGCRAAGERLKEAGHPASELSMGMSNDYEIAVEEGATLVRLGTVLFGARS